jgi:hypothetical protein
MRNKTSPRANQGALAAFTAAYVAFACGLKLDGFITLSWTVILAPVWLPVAIIVAIAALYVAVCCIVILLAWAIRKLRGNSL